MQKLHVAAACSTNEGKLRLKNEDNFYFNGRFLSIFKEGQSWYDEYTSAQSPQLFGVFDGMGGEHSGEKASFIAASQFAKAAAGILKSPQSIDTIVKKYIREANSEICKEIIKNSGRRMGTTLAVLCLYENNAYIYNIGDSRIYRCRKSKLEQLSIDHTEIQMLIKMNIIKSEEAKVHPLSHKLTQHLGIFEEELMIEPHYIKIPIEPKDKFLLCSDGLTDMVSEEFIKNVLDYNASPSEIVKKLTEEALQNGGKDNVTLIAIEVQPQKNSVINTIIKLIGK